MKLLLNVLLSGLYVKLRGRSQTETQETGNNLTYPHRFLDAEDKSQTVILFCEQLAHKVSFSRFYMPSRQYFTYKVRVVLLTGEDECQRMPILCYPHLCADWMAGGTYPHHCAINAYIDNVFEDAGADKHLHA